MNSLIFAITALVLWAGSLGHTTTPTTPRKTISMAARVKIRKVKCPKCKKKVWGSKKDIGRASLDCEHDGQCGLHQINTSVVPFERKKESLPAVLLPKEDGAYEFEVADPLVIHIVSAEERYVK